MEKTKLTIRVSRKILEQAKRYASLNQTSLTRLITEYMRQLSSDDELLSESPIVARLSGILSPKTNLEDYQQYLEGKYGAQTPHLD